jgi:hypothetical protein
MELNSCPCGARLSPNAGQCPRCGRPQLRATDKTFACRACGQSLNVADHYVETFHEYQVSGTTRMSRSHEQRPCRYCGEPNPVPVGVMSTTWVKKTLIPFIFLCVLLYVLVKCSF